jgi:hypothetical protein
MYGGLSGNLRTWCRVDFGFVAHILPAHLSRALPCTVMPTPDATGQTHHADLLAFAAVIYTRSARKPGSSRHLGRRLSGIAAERLNG